MNAYLCSLLRYKDENGMYDLRLLRSSSILNDVVQGFIERDILVHEMFDIMSSTSDRFVELENSKFAILDTIHVLQTNEKRFIREVIYVTKCNILLRF